MLLWFKQSTPPPPPPYTVHKRSYRNYILLVLLIAGTYIHALDTSSWNNTANHQKIYPINSEEYQLLSLLYISCGLALPSTAGPWSEDELLLMLSRLEPSALNDAELKVYAYLERTFTETKKVFGLHIDIAPEIYAHTNPNIFFLPDAFVRDPLEARPFLSFKLDSHLTKWGYGFADISLGTALYTTQASQADGYKEQPASVLFGANTFATNILFLSQNGLQDFDITVPHRAFVSIGSRGWNFQFGRERLEWGPGESGNFLLGSQIDYHNMGKLTFYGDKLKYTYLISSFIHPSEYYDYMYSPQNDSAPYTSYAPINSDNIYNGINLFIAHRLEWRLFNKFNIALNEGLMYLNEENYLPLEVLVPTMLMHNLYRRMNTNSIINIELDWTPIRHLNVYAQLVLDELNFAFSENTANEATPEANGFMLGAKTAFPLLSGFFSASLEGAYTSPYLYLRSRAGAVNEQQAGEYGAGFIAANRYITTEYVTRFVEKFLGYRYGGDAVVVNAHAAYSRLGSFSLGAQALFMIHGTHDQYTAWSRVNKDWAPTYQNLTTQHQTPNHLDTDPMLMDSVNPDAGNVNTGASGLRNAASYTVALSLKGAWTVLKDIPWVKSLEVYGQVDIVGVINHGNIKRGPVYDLQFTCGLRHSL
jgi:hypothetical protein